jgi:threonine synthase
MRPDAFPEDIRSHLIPKPTGQLMYRCLDCQAIFDIKELLYTCPKCGQVLLIDDSDPDRHKAISGKMWRRIFDFRKMLTLPALKGIYRYHEFLGPILPLDSIVYLGEGHTPIVAANNRLQQQVGLAFYFKNDGQNPSASFKDRGMASALSYIHFLIRTEGMSDILAVCASTGDTSAAAALYSAYLSPKVKSAVLLPHKKVTPQQLSQPLGNGATVFEIPGVFDDCMKVVEALSGKYQVALLNSKNAWRILGQESYSYEIAQDFEYDLTSKVVVVPIGNAGNITAVMRGFIKFYQAGIIDTLPKIVGVQSDHADPVYRYYQQADPDKRQFKPIAVRPSVAQAAMIGNPVSMPRVAHIVDRYNTLSGAANVFFVQVTEQQIMDWHLKANQHGHIACTHGGECLAGLMVARQLNYVAEDETAILDATAHPIKFSGFQEMYFEQSFPPEYEVSPDATLINRPIRVQPPGPVPTPKKVLSETEMTQFVATVSKFIATALDLDRGPSS